jgi:hypothetical protein
MRMTKVRGYSLAMMAMLALCGQAVAADVTCPAVSAIKEGETSNANTQQEEKNYSAKENGKEWTGSVSTFDEHQADLKTLSPGKASVANDKGLVACDYYNGATATLRLTTKTSNPPPR